MPQTRDCDFCGSEIPPGTGTMFVRTDGTAIHYCSSKCEKNADLGREPRDVEWIQDEEAEQLRRAEEGSDTVDDEDVEDEGPTSAEEQAGEAGEEQASESGDAEASESEGVDDDLEEDAAEQREEESTDADEEEEEAADADEESAEPEEDAEA